MISNYLIQVKILKIKIKVKRAWSSVGASGEYVPPRRNHIAVGSGRLMFINGGLGSDGEVLNDTWTFNFESKTWSPMYVNKLPPNLSHHAAAAVFNNPDRVNDIGSRKIKPYYEKVNFFFLKFF